MQQLSKIYIENHGKGKYPCYRIPGIVVTAAGTILVYYETRLNASDWSTRNIGYRRSCDDGDTWSEMRELVINNSDAVINNPVFIASKTGRVHFFYQIDYRRAFHSYSDDDGICFTEPVEITYVFENYRPKYNWSLYALGPGHGIELQDGKLLIPVWICNGEGNAHTPTVISAIVSDDDGKTFKNGDIIYATDEIVSPNETTAVQLEDGSIMLNIRHAGSKKFRAVSISPDGLTSYTTPVLDENLRDPGCFASILRGYSEIADGFSGIIFSNCNFKEVEDHSNRKHLTIRLSLDEGKSWSYEKELELFSGYSDIAISKNKKWIFCFYEGEWFEGSRGFPPRHLVLAKFNLEWLTDGERK